MVRKILIGCSGWSYDEWVGPFYPKNLTNKDFLQYYTKIYYTNEINTTFYHIPSRWMVKRWAEQTPDDFVFSAKIPRIITHENKLDVDNCFGELEIYLDAMEPLVNTNKLLTFLIQLPPSFKKSAHFENLKQFIHSWPSDYKTENYNLTVEFRHKSWMNKEVFKFLRDEELSYCAVIEPLLPPRMDITNKQLVYIRFHGFGKKPWFNYLFSEDEIKKYAKQIKENTLDADTIGIYFNNHFSGYAAKNSLMMMEELGVEPRNTPDEINILDIKKESGTIDKDQTSLDKFF
ncbi:MAG: DUF72 domain-containing protein [Promethearchaeota archaeon]|nr:MAG: DUF72 domain-containing protein [Candidatus Lokiarchaeota archaeon]